jgi:hypothetical protein
MEFVTLSYGFTAWQGTVSPQLVEKISWHYVTSKDMVFVLKWLFEHLNI